MTFKFFCGMMYFLYPESLYLNGFQTRESKVQTSVRHPCKDSEKTCPTEKEFVTLKMDLTYSYPTSNRVT